jgi:hypothetical protein
LLDFKKESEENIFLFLALSTQIPSFRNNILPDVHLYLNTLSNNFMLYYGTVRSSERAISTQILADLGASIEYISD